MNFFTSLFHRAASSGAKQNRLARIFRILREHAVVIGMLTLVSLAAGVLLFDGLIFYRDVVAVRQPAAGSGKKISLSEKEISKTMKLLDARQKAFDAILDTFGGAENAASSTKVR